MKLHFLGACRTVTGSKTLVSYQNKRVLVDAGMFQGQKEFRLQNWRPFPVAPSSIDAILLTHAHIDHSGYLPVLRKHGFDGPIYCTPGTKALCEVLLPDAGFLQEEDARYANKKGFSKHSPALPLYTEKEARKTLELFETVSKDQTLSFTRDWHADFYPAGHILGASSIRLATPDTSICFSGDIGRYDDLMMYPPHSPPHSDYVVMESTYGDSFHEACDSYEMLAKIISDTIGRGGIVLIPAFAVGRAQLLLHIITQLKEQQRIPQVPIFLNSPMAIRATEIYSRYNKQHKLTIADCKRIDQHTTYVRTMEESIELNNRSYPSVIISASGMASGGRVLHHLKTMAGNYRNSIVFSGFQAPGTRGDAMVNGATQIKMHGQYIPIKAEVHQLTSFSAHADQKGLLHWLSQIAPTPKRVFINHGESLASDMLKGQIESQLSIPTECATEGQQINL